ncbi:PREDICTED: dimethylaniline monooxygenase [N-oxide-forming] 5-like [Cyprinodon variegatus]|uniref:dimethylaniline monooxygenase [N-oxide-forming] 5-like n=1 Tax=Cyprinodon variegatus TaxID=28743 RepID=UPI00074259BA|nr:PREDICTED: dimethylaniline monooxygenase [N-oxide-forming] 5-like [Cyprinodon variegatus]
MAEALAVVRSSDTIPDTVQGATNSLLNSVIIVYYINTESADRSYSLCKTCTFFISGIETFKGKYFHSRDYKTPEEWRNKKAVVIGIGNSGGDIAVELSRVTKQVYLSTRRGAWILNRVGNSGMPLDMLISRTMNMMRNILPSSFICSLGEKQLNSRFNHSLYNLKPKHRYQMFANLVENCFKGKVRSARNNQWIIQNQWELPHARAWLFACGVEMELSGRARLGLCAELVMRGEGGAAMYVRSQRHTIQVDYVNYMDEIADQVGVRPRISRLLLTDPRLGLNLLFGPCTPYQYRLRGPGKWAGARQAILTQWERVAQPMQTRPCNEPEPQRWRMWPLLLSSAALGLAAFCHRSSLLAILQDPAALLEKMKSFLPTY